MYQEFYFLSFFNKVLFFGFIFYCKMWTWVCRVFISDEKEIKPETGSSCNYRAGHRGAAAGSKRKSAVQFKVKPDKKIYTVSQKLSSI